MPVPLPGCDSRAERATNISAFLARDSQSGPVTRAHECAHPGSFPDLGWADMQL